MARHPRITAETLPTLDLKQLHALWQNTFRSSPPSRMPKEFVVKLLSQALQEQSSQGGTKAIERQLRTVDLPGAERNAQPPTPSNQLNVGSRLIRGWGGVSHEVMVLDRAFAYRGKSYRSLSEIAKVITGSHWSGPRFFGLKKNWDVAAREGTTP